MAGRIGKVLVIGMGKVGSLVATLLENSGFSVMGLDMHPRSDLPFPTEACDVTNSSMIDQKLAGVDAVVSCLPYHLNLRVATSAHKAGIHYFDLTEDVPTTNAIREMARSAKGVMAPQCGLAPGFIGIVGASLAERFDDLRSIELRVGALPQNPKGLLGYAFNWSPEGVVNEYLNDCEVIQNSEIKMIPAMQEHETVVIRGNKLEAFTTSGGLGTMCESFEGRVDDLNYKTLRYPGHCEMIRFLFNELLLRDDPTLAGKILVNAKPPVNDDVVYVYAAVEGTKERPRVMNQGLYREEFVRAYYPKTVNNKEWRAISWTTAASVTAVVELVAQGVLTGQGFIKQEKIPFDAFLKTKAGSMYQTEV
ncbi:MAG: Saccharopine dehydrogenase [Rickettsiales bacterium]|jgi:saccharopine dehydrogenase-like NADP-dependent oxidoreductase|nr:Saccharopine dehydrogenase [Rickettsiales bacterium]